MPAVEIDETDLTGMQRLVEDAIRELDADLFLSHVAQALSQVTDLIGVVISPSFEQGVFDRLEIVNLGGSRYIIIVSLKSGLVKTINITVERVIPRRKVEETARLLTARLTGLTVSEIKRTIGIRLDGVRDGDSMLLDIIMNRSSMIFGFSEEKGVYLAGLSRLLAHPDFATVDYSLRLADLFERKGDIAEALRNTVPEEDVGINIGGSGPWGIRPPLSLVSAAYRSGNASGSIAIIGPARVHYPRLSAIVRYTALMTTRFFSS
jgi:heat-inducible transcriptional repressor